jgi:very-short-patch-repair endonuclease
MAGTPATAQLRTTAAGLNMQQPVVACLHTAAELHGFDVCGADDTHVIGTDGRRQRPGLVVHSAALGAQDVCRYTGVPATTAERTAVDLARTLPRLDGLAVLDAALRTGMVSRRELQGELARHEGRRGIVAARELVALADARAESPMESRSRLRCLDGGLPAPELQIEVRASGHRYRLDLGWSAQKVAPEYDGLEYHGSHASLRHDRERHNWLTAQGWTMIYATARQVLSAPEELIAQIWRALQTAAA